MNIALEVLNLKHDLQKMGCFSDSEIAQRCAYIREQLEMGNTDVLNEDRAADEINWRKIQETFTRLMRYRTGRGYVKLKITGQLSHQQLTLSKTASGRRRGGVYIALDGEWLLCILEDGSLDINHYLTIDFPEWVTPLLSEFSNNPSEVAARSGKMSGRCTVCNRKLTDNTSLSVGYGATCANNMGWDYQLIKENVTL